MDKISKVKSISIWVFIIPFIALNLCLILVTQFHGLFPNKLDVIHSTIPYIDGGASISRTARGSPTYWFFKIKRKTFPRIKNLRVSSYILGYLVGRHHNFKAIELPRLFGNWNPL